MGHKLSRIIKKAAVQMKDGTFSGRDPVLIIAFLQNFKAFCDACNIHIRATLWLLQNFLTGPVEAVIKVRVAPSTKSAKAQGGCLKLYSAVVNVLLKRYATDDNITVVDGVKRQFRHGGTSAREHAQQQSTKAQRYASINTINILMGLSVEGVMRSICRALRQ